MKKLSDRQFQRRLQMAPASPVSCSPTAPVPGRAEFTTAEGKRNDGKWTS